MKPAAFDAASCSSPSPAELAHQRCGRSPTRSAGLAQRQILQDVGDVGGLGRRSTPAVTSALFSRSASLADSASVAFSEACRSWRPAPGRARGDRIGVDRDEQVGLGRAGDSARARRAARRRRRCGSSRPGSCRRPRVASRSVWAKPNTMSFSNSPLAAMVPGSMPPWPGSTTISGRGSPAASAPPGSVSRRARRRGSRAPSCA